MGLFSRDKKDQKKRGRDAQAAGAGNRVPSAPNANYANQGYGQYRRNSSVDGYTKGYNAAYGQGYNHGYYGAQGYGQQQQQYYGQQQTQAKGGNDGMSINMGGDGQGMRLKAGDMNIDMNHQGVSLQQADGSAIRMRADGLDLVSSGGAKISLNTGQQQPASPAPQSPQHAICPSPTAGFHQQTACYAQAQPAPHFHQPQCIQPVYVAQQQQMAPQMAPQMVQPQMVQMPMQQMQQMQQVQQVHQVVPLTTTSTTHFQHGMPQQVQAMPQVIGGVPVVVPVQRRM